MAERKWKNEIIAWANGAVIESRCQSLMSNKMSVWFEEVFPHFFEDACWEYRIKPKPKVKKWRWVSISKDGEFAITVSYFHDNNEYQKIFTIPNERGWRLFQKIDGSEIEVEAE